MDWSREGCCLAWIGLPGGTGALCRYEVRAPRCDRPTADHRWLLPRIAAVCHHRWQRTPPRNAGPDEGSTMPDSAPVTTPVKGTLLQGKRGLIMGVANERSLAW